MHLYVIEGGDTANNMHQLKSELSSVGFDINLHNNIQPQFTLLDGINTVSEGPWFGASLLYARGVAWGLREDLLFAQFLEANK